MSDVSDEQLMLQVIRKDRSAFKTIYERHKRSVLGLAYKMLRERSAAEEVMQETFWRIWTNASSFDSRRGSFSNWMFGIARNLATDILRRGQKIQMQALPDVQNFHIESSHYFLDDQDVAETTHWLVLTQQIQVAMNELPEEQRDVVEWIYFQGKTRRQIAQEYGIPFGTINTRARLALDKLKRVLQAQGLES